VKQIQAWIGHADPGFTLSTYIHLMDAGMGSAALLDQFRENRTPVQRTLIGRYLPLWKWQDRGMHPMEPVELSGDLVAIEPLSAEHAPGLLAAADAEEVFAWLPYPQPIDLEGAEAWIADALADRDAFRRLPFAVLNARDRSVLGSTSYWGFDAHNAHVEIGSTWLSRAVWGTGRNAEGKLLLMGHAFEGLGLERIAFRTDIRNVRSQRAIEQLGAVKEGVHRHEMRRRDGSWRDSVYYSILSPEWPVAESRLRDRIAAAETH